MSKKSFFLEIGILAPTPTPPRGEGLSFGDFVPEPLCGAFAPLSISTDQSGSLKKLPLILPGKNDLPILADNSVEWCVDTPLRPQPNVLPLCHCSGIPHRPKIRSIGKAAQRYIFRNQPAGRTAVCIANPDAHRIGGSQYLHWCRDAIQIWIAPVFHQPAHHITSVH